MSKGMSKGVCVELVEDPVPGARFQIGSQQFFDQEPKKGGRIFFPPFFLIPLNYLTTYFLATPFF